MCGIVVILESNEDAATLRQKAIKLAKRVRHRGPDWSGVAVQEIKSNESKSINVFAHERLAIVDPATGAQPITSADGSVVLAVNGEIYNHKKLRATILKDCQFQSNVDCEVILHLYQKFGDNFLNYLDGIFAFVISDRKTGKWLAARDHMGIIPLYVGHDKQGAIWFASEMKALHDQCARFEEFPPGNYWTKESGGFKRWYEPQWWNESIPTAPLDLKLLRETFEKAVVKQLMTDVPYGVLLSGGLDSSLVASIVTRHALKRIEDNEQTPAWWPRVHSFSIGLQGSPDLQAAQTVSKFLNTVHHEFHFTVQEGIDAIPDVIYHIETYDITTIRASTPMYLLSRKIKAMGIKMVLSGEGSDEIFGGYLYFHKAPSPEKFHVETCHKLKALHKFDCLRANKSTMAWGVEARVPFLDADFLEVAMGIDPQEKMIDLKKGRIEKYILRKAFDDEENPYLPRDILWRQKEQFSDGVGYSWIDSLKNYAEQQVSDELFRKAAFRFPVNTPTSKEGYLYRSIFEGYFPSESAVLAVPGGPSVACSTPAAIEWDLAWKNNHDPSGRAVADVHGKSLDQPETNGDSKKRKEPSSFFTDEQKSKK